MSTENAPLALSLALCLMLSWASERIGMAAIIGAFFAGLVLADYEAEWDLQPQIRAIHDLLAPFFFFAIGARLDISLFSGNVLWAAAIVTVLAIVSKLLGCGLPIINEGWRTALHVSVGMVPRGEVALIVALIGLQMNVISQSAYAIVIFMTAVTTLLAPLALRWMLRDRYVERIATPVSR
jgi:Kef-type K+ transport system membrane component KefB